jgi:SpoVK/Ycf46/Vps4 family AAA+-type ATPase
MSRIRHLTKLFKAIAANDLNIAEDVAAQIAADEEKKGHHVAAQTLRGSLRPNSKGDSRFVGSENGIYHQSKILSPALTAVNNPTRIKDVMLSRNSRKELSEVVREWKHSKQLSALKIRIRNRLFFYGPPGCGKSLTAQALGLEMSLPTYVVRFDAVIGAYLGQTALHLRELFRFAEQTPCVLVFDEVDALAKQRGNPLDVGELDRIVISFMQELEHSQTKGIIVATSNLPNHLDKALWRRFDLTMEFRKPSPSDLRMFVLGKIKSFDTKLSRNQINQFIKAQSYAEAEKCVESVVRQIALQRIERSSCQKKKTK